MKIKVNPIETIPEDGTLFILISSNYKGVIHLTTHVCIGDGSVSGLVNITKSLGRSVLGWMPCPDEIEMVP